MQTVLALCLGGLVGILAGLAVGAVLYGAFMRHLIETDSNWRASLRKKMDKYDPPPSEPEPEQPAAPKIDPAVLRPGETVDD